MIIRAKNAKEFMCPMTLPSGKPMACCGKKCAVFMLSHLPGSYHALIRKYPNDEFGYCGFNGGYKFPHMQDYVSTLIEDGEIEVPI